MRRSFFAVLSCLILSAALQAQRSGGGFHGGAGGGFHGGFGHGGNGIGIGPGNGFSRGFRDFNHHRGFGWVWPPYWWDWGYWGGLDWDFPYWDYVNFPPTNMRRESYYPSDDQASDPSPDGQSSRPVIVMRSKEPAPAVEPPKVTEVPLSKDAPVVTQQPATLFVLSDGERLESRHYVLTADSLQIEIGRKQRTVPVSKLNLDATIAANQQRGIELTIPQDRNSLFLGF
jgi:hypothetical protein